MAHHFQQLHARLMSVHYQTYDHAKWLKLNDIKEILSQIGFSDIVVYKDDKKQFAPRVTIYAARPGMMRN